MCGIIAIVDLIGNDVCESLLDGLHIMEYRGYDSAGIITIQNSQFQFRKSIGKISKLKNLYSHSPISGHIGLGHTRWATHGKLSLNNTHPIISHNIAVVHNGIIENHLVLRKMLENFGESFDSDTDTEVISLLIHHYNLRIGLSFEEAVRQAINELKGNFTCVALNLNEPSKIIGVCRGLSLLVGMGRDRYYLTSDVLSIAKDTHQMFELRDGQIVVIEPNKFVVTDQSGNCVVPKILKTNVDTNVSRDKGCYDNFMLKEIFEQPKIVHQLLNLYKQQESVLYRTLNKILLKNYSSICIIACGTSFYAANIAKYIIESETKITVDIEISSEFISKTPKVNSSTLYIFISQSGETADTLACLKYCKLHRNITTVAISNVENSKIARSTDYLLQTFCEPEIAVASTKSFIGQIMILVFLCDRLIITYSISQKKEKEVYSAFFTSFCLAINNINIDAIIKRLQGQIENLSKDLVKARYILYIGRNICYPLAKEGALKMKELAYIPSEGIASGELKHGPIALVDKDIPIIALAPMQNEIFAKIASNIEEIHARDGKIILLSTQNGIERLKHLCYECIELPEEVDKSSAAISIIYTIPMQLLAYFVALKNGYDVDKPRHLAKSVTVE